MTITTKKAENAANAVEILGELNFRNVTFVYHGETNAHGAPVVYRHFDGINADGNGTCFGLIEIVINGKLDTVRFINSYRETAVDIKIGDASYTLGDKGEINLIDEPETVTDEVAASSMVIEVKTFDSGRFTVKLNGKRIALSVLEQPPYYDSVSSDTEIIFNGRKFRNVGRNNHGNAHYYNVFTDENGYGFCVTVGGLGDDIWELGKGMTPIRDVKNEIAQIEAKHKAYIDRQNAIKADEPETVNAIKKFEVGKTYAAKKSVLFDSQINMTVIKRTKCYVSFQFDDEDDICRCKIVDDAGVEKICIHETNALDGDYEFSANDVADETATDETATDEVKADTVNEKFTTVKAETEIARFEVGKRYRGKLDCGTKKIDCTIEVIKRTAKCIVYPTGGNTNPFCTKIKCSDTSEYISPASGLFVKASDVVIEPQPPTVDEPKIDSDASIVEVADTLNELDAAEYAITEEAFNVALDAEIELAAKTDEPETVNSEIDEVKAEEKVEKLFDAYEAQNSVAHISENGYIAAVNFQPQNTVRWHCKIRRYENLDEAIDAVRYVNEHDTFTVTRGGRVEIEYGKRNERTREYFARNLYGVEYFKEAYFDELVDQYAVTVDAFNFAVECEIEEAEIAAAESKAIARILADEISDAQRSLERKIEQGDDTNLEQIAAVVPPKTAGGTILLTLKAAKHGAFANLLDKRDELTKQRYNLGKLKRNGIITEAEYADKAAELDSELRYAEVQIDAVKAGDTFDYVDAAEHIKSVYEDLQLCVDLWTRIHGLTVDKKKKTAIITRERR